MFLIKLFNILKGYVIITVRGLFLERFLNICTRRGICVWNIQRSGKTEMTACISIQDFKCLKPIVKKAYCRVHIVKRVGLPFILYRHKKRKALLFGAVITLILLFFMTNFIWVIDISGNNQISLKTLETELTNAGLVIGKPVKSIDIYDIQNRMMTNIPKLAWIGINLKGTTAIIEVKERNQLPPAFPKDQPCSIIAKTAGVIERADIKEGEKLIKTGDVVTKGQILVSGVLEGELSGIRYVHSDGEIIARTWHEKTVEMPLYKEIRAPTGNKKSKNSIKIYKFNVNLYLNDRISFNNYDRISYIKKLSLGNGYALPVEYHHDSYVEQNVQQIEMTMQEVIKKVQTDMDNELKGIDIVSRSHKTDGNKLIVTYECLENIIEKVGFNFDNGENN